MAKRNSTYSFGVAVWIGVLAAFGFSDGDPTIFTWFFVLAFAVMVAIGLRERSKGD